MKQEHITQIYGYARISDKSQKLNRQMDFFRELGIGEKNIFVDRASGKNFDRPAYQKMIRKLQSGDTLYVKELDRLGRNKTEIKDELAKLRKKGVRVKITNIPTTMCDFGENDWILDTVNNIVIEVLAAVAEQERLTNRKRQAEGIAAAKARGVRLGRPPLELPVDFHVIYQKYKNRKMSRKEILEYYNIDSSRFYVYARSYENRISKSSIK